MAELRFFKCDRCGELVMEVDRGHCVPQCCGQEMRVLEAGVVEAAAEKHVPVVVREGDRVIVRVGEVAHPMLEEHYIEWIALVEDGRTELRYLKPGDAPEARFACDGDAKVSVYAYCNLHGLWKSEL